MFTNFLANWGNAHQALGIFTQTYRCYSVAMIGKSDTLEGSGKIILPASALDQLAHLQIEYPMLFELTNPSQAGKKTHCGVLEFTAEEGTCYVPYWMMQLLLVEEGNFIHVKSATLPKGSYVKLQPQSSTFLDISNPKAVLETRLRNFSTMTVGDVIKIEYNKNWYYISVVEVKPDGPTHAISIVETDLNLDFVAPPDYKEKTVSTPTKTTSQPVSTPTSSKHKEEESDEEEDPKFKAFTGTGYTLRSPAAKSGFGTSPKSPVSTGMKVGTPPANNKKKEESDDEDSEDEEDAKKKFKAFSGTGYSLRN